jgi:hypothetical protein
MILLWPGPVPVAHSHEDVPHTVVANVELLQHVMQHHVSTRARFSEPKGFHVHWVVRSQYFDGINCEEILLQTSTTADALSTLDCSAELSPLHLPVVLVTPPQHTHVEKACPLSFQIVGFLDQRLSLPELFGVMLC